MNLRNTLLGALVAGLFAMAGPASADPIIAFGQAGVGTPITGTASATGTVWGGTDVAITVTGIAAGNPVPLAAFLDISATSITGAASVNLPPLVIVQRFSGTFSINSAADGSGINYLSGSFSDGALTRNAATGIAVFAPEGVFVSDVITTLFEPLSINFALTGVSPAVSLLACTNTNPGCSTGQTINSFVAAISGDADAAIPEPATIALFGASLLGLGVLRRRRQAAA